MSDGVNLVMLTGFVGKDPEMIQLSNGTVVANFSLATKREKDQNGERLTDWHYVKAFGKVAEIIQQYVHRGSLIYIEGQVRTRTYQTQTGEERKTTEVILGPRGQLTLLDKAPSRDRGNDADAY